MANTWVNRTTSQPVYATDAAGMTERYGSGVDFHTYSNNAEWLYDPDLSAVTGEPVKYWIITGDVVTLMDQAAKDAVDADELSATRDSQANIFDGVEAYERAFALMLLDEINGLSNKINAILDAIDAANNLGDVKTAIAAVADRPIRTIADIKTGFRNKLGS